MKTLKFEDLLKEELEDLYDAEKQIVNALPKMVEAASAEDLKAAFQEHLEQTVEQVARLERVFEAIGEQPGGKQCEGMQGLLKESEKMIQEMEKSPVLDAALIGAAQKVEHYEISGLRNRSHDGRVPGTAGCRRPSGRDPRRREGCRRHPY